MQPSMGADGAHRAVVAAVVSLYKDKLKPYGDILVQRLVERGAVGRSFNLDRLRAICQECSLLVVQTETARLSRAARRGCHEPLPADASRNFSVFLADRPRLLNDPHDRADPFSQAMWDELRAYFAEDGAGSNASWTENRYKCAVEVARLGLRHLRGFYLGEVAHVVWLAIDSRKILGTRFGRIVPYWKSEAGTLERGRPQVPAGRASQSSSHRRVSSPGSPVPLSDESGGAGSQPAAEPPTASGTSPSSRRQHGPSPNSPGPLSGSGSGAGDRPAVEPPTASGATRGGAEATPPAGGGLATEPPGAAATTREGRPIWRTALLPDVLAFDVRLTFVSVGSSPAPGRGRLSASAPPACRAGGG